MEADRRAKQADSNIPTEIVARHMRHFVTDRSREQLVRRAGPKRFGQNNDSSNRDWTRDLVRKEHSRILNVQGLFTALDYKFEIAAQPFLPRTAVDMKRPTRRP